MTRIAARSSSSGWAGIFGIQSADVHEAQPLVLDVDDARKMPRKAAL
jgi:hypothetical protein